MPGLSFVILSPQVPCRLRAVRSQTKASTSVWRPTLQAHATRPLLTCMCEVRTRQCRAGLSLWSGAALLGVGTRGWGGGAALGLVSPSRLFLQQSQRQHRPPGTPLLSPPLRLPSLQALGEAAALGSVCISCRSCWAQSPKGVQSLPGRPVCVQAHTLVCKCVCTCLVFLECALPSPQQGGLPARCACPLARSAWRLPGGEASCALSPARTLCRGSGGGSPAGEHLPRSECSLLGLSVLCVFTRPGTWQRSWGPFWSVQSLLCSQPKGHQSWPPATSCEQAGSAVHGAQEEPWEPFYPTPTVPSPSPPAQMGVIKAKPAPPGDLWGKVEATSSQG